MALEESNPDGHPEVSAYLVVRKSDGTFVMVQGSDAGDFASIGGDSPGLRIARESQAVVNGNTEEFSITQDVDLNALPAKMNIRGIIVTPHNGAATPAPVSTQWRLRIYTHSNRNIDDIIKDEDRTGVAASDATYYDWAPWSFVNEEGNGAILCSLTIPGAQNDATFTVRVVFA